MDANERDKLSGDFAALTCYLEDATAVAVEGQSARLTLPELKIRIEDLWPMLTQCAGVLASIERRMVAMDKED